MPDAEIYHPCPAPCIFPYYPTIDHVICLGDCILRDFLTLHCRDFFSPENPKK